MDTRDGSIHQLGLNETVKELADRLWARKSDIVPLGNLRDEQCQKCNGRGYKPAGLNSKRFVPCKCTGKFLRR